MNLLNNSLFIAPLLYLSCLWGLTTQPYIQLFSSSNSELYTYEELRLNHLAIGFKNTYINKRVSLETNFSYHFYDCLNQKPNDFNPVPGLGNIENSPGLADNQFNFFDAIVRFVYKTDKMSFYFGRSNPIWGPGIYPIFISDKAPEIFNIGYSIELGERISYEHMYGSLNSQIQDSTYQSIYTDSNYNVFSEIPRSISAHRIEYKPYKNTTLAIVEIIVYGGARNIEPYYLLPLLPFLPIQTYLGDIDNDMLGFYFIHIHKTFKIHGSLLIDEWSPSYSFKNENKNWMIYQLGIQKEALLLKSDKLILEYTYSDNRVFKHRFPINDYYSYGYPLGFWAGPHSDNIYIRYLVKFNNNIFSLAYIRTRRGELEEISVGKYDGVYINQFSGIVEQKATINFEIESNMNKNTKIIVGYNYIDWINAGFNPMNVNKNGLDNIIKNDFYFHLNYNFKDYKI